MTRIVMTRPVHRDAIELLRGRAELIVGPSEPPIPTADEVRALIRDADVVYTLPSNPLDARAIQGAPRLRLIATMGTGYDNIDLAAARERGITVTNAPGMLDDTTADLAFALILAAARRVGEAERHLRAGLFGGWTPFQFLGLDVYGATLGIVGLGRIGTAVARRARGFAMRVVYTGPQPHPEIEHELAARFVSLDELLRTSDVVSLHVPLRPETRHLIDAAALRKMKPSAILVNTSRGPIVDEQALAEALRDGVIGGAGIDVYEREPEVVPLLLEQERAVLLPHIGSSTDATRRRMALRAAENVIAFLEGRPVLDAVD